MSDPRLADSVTALMYAGLSAGIWDGNSNGAGRSSAWLALNIGRNGYSNKALNPRVRVKLL